MVSHASCGMAHQLTQNIDAFFHHQLSSRAHPPPHRNSGAICMIQDKNPTRRSKYIDIRNHAVNERALRGIILLTKVQTTQQKSNFLTKCFSRAKFEHNVALIRNLSPSCPFAQKPSRGLTTQDRTFDLVAHKRPSGHEYFCDSTRRYVTM